MTFINFESHFYFMGKSLFFENSTTPLGAYPHSKVVGNLLFLSGIGPRNSIDNSIPGLELDKYGNYIAFNFEKQCISVFENVKQILENSGSRWENLVDVTVFLTDMKRDFHTYNKLYKSYFENAMPCRTTVEVSSLPSSISIELKCIATID